MDQQLERLRKWANRTTMPRLYTELAMRLAGEGYELELQGDDLTICGWQRPAGWRGWLRRPQRQALLRFVHQDGQVTVLSEPADPVLVSTVLERLGRRT